MPEFAPGAVLQFAVPMQKAFRLARQLYGAALAQQINHGKPFAHKFNFGQGPVEAGAQMIFELAAGQRILRVMGGIMDPRREFIDDQAAFGCIL